MPFDMRLEVARGTTELDTSTNASSILAIDGFFCFLATFVVALRIFVRAKMLKTIGPDDFLITAATLCGIGAFACFVSETHHGMGLHTASIPVPEFVLLSRLLYIHGMVLTFGISLAKLSVGFFLLRLVPSIRYKRVLWGMIVFLISFTFTSEGALLFSCIPIRASWDPASAPNAKCFSKHLFNTIGFVSSGINFATDIIFASLPIPIVYHLQINTRTKVSLIVILSLGYFACVCSIIKINYQAKFWSDHDSTSDDLWFFWNNVELYTGILAASLPCLRPLFKRMLASTPIFTSSNHKQNKSGTANPTGCGVGVTSRGHRKAGYYMQDEEGLEGIEMKSKNRTVVIRAIGESEENILPIQKLDRFDGRSGGIGVTQTVDVQVN